MSRAGALRMLGGVGLVAWCTVSLVGPLVTSLPPYDEARWWWWPALRVAWALGSALAMTTGLAHEPEGLDWRRWLIVGGASMGLSLALNLNPVLDLVSGPRALDGHLADFDVHRGRLASRPTSRTPTIEGTLTWVGGAERLTIEPSGMQANRAEAALAQCPTGAGRLVVLRHLDVVLALHCAN